MPKLYQGCLAKPKADDFLALIIEPVLCHLSEVPFSKAASELLLGTAIKESQNFKYRRQIVGPALSYFQIEPATHDDIWDNYLRYRPKLANQIKQLLTSPTASKLHELEHNDNYAAAMARIVYKRAPDKLPTFNDTSAMANYWKKHYNTPLGKGTPPGYISIWNTSTRGLTLNYRDKCK